MLSFAQNAWNTREAFYAIEKVFGPEKSLERSTKAILLPPSYSSKGEESFEAPNNKKEAQNQSVIS